MQNQVQIFKSKEFGKVRLVEQDGQPWWILRGLEAQTLCRHNTIQPSKFN